MPQCCFDWVDLSLSRASLEHWPSAIFLPRDEIDAAKVARGFESHPSADESRSIVRRFHW
jgi:hypothetical protein